MMVSGRGGAPGSGRCPARVPVVGAGGVCVDPLDVEAWSDAIGSLLAADARRAELGAAARARADEFSWDRCAAQTAAVYHEVS